MNAWSHLPNAAHIDRVIESLKSHPDIWNAAWRSAWYEAWDKAWDKAWDEARGAARGAARDAARDAAWDAAWGAILALVAYDNSAKYLNMTVDQLKTWASLTEDPAAVLLLPAVTTFEKISKLEMV